MTRQIGGVVLACAVASSACGCAPAMDGVRHDLATPQRSTVVLGGAAAVAAAAAVGFTIGGAIENGAIKDGGFATGKDIEAAASRGDSFNQAAVVSGALALGLVAAAIGVYLYGSPPSEPVR